MILAKDIEVEGRDKSPDSIIPIKKSFIIPRGTTIYYKGEDHIYSSFWSTEKYEGIYVVKSWPGMNKEIKAYRRKHVIYLNLKEDEIIDDKFQEAIIKIALRVDCGELNPR